MKILISVLILTSAIPAFGYSGYSSAATIVVSAATSYRSGSSAYRRSMIIHAAAPDAAAYLGGAEASELLKQTFSWLRQSQVEMSALDDGNLAIIILQESTATN